MFFDKASLPAGGDYHSRIQNAVQGADIFIFLITPNSVAQGSYAPKELKYAREKWADPKEKILSVLVRATDWTATPLISSPLLSWNQKVMLLLRC